MNLVLLIPPGVELLSLVELLLESAAVVGEGHVAIDDGQTLHVLLKLHLFLVVVGQLIDEFVEVFSEMLLLDELVLV